MLLNHTQTIEKAGGRKTDVGLIDGDERLSNVDRFIFLFLQREERLHKQLPFPASGESSRLFIACFCSSGFLGRGLGGNHSLANKEWFRLSKK